jgi:hypothetical protein
MELNNTPYTDMKESELSVEEINSRIKQEICYDTLNKLSEQALMDEYRNCASVRNEINKLGHVLEKYVESTETKETIIEEYLSELIPAGTKGVIRGNKFNAIVKQFIINLNLDATRFEICFEKKCEDHLTAEIPDWYILEKATNKILIGMNQLDLTSGGHQINRGFKYLIDNKHNNQNSKLLCVICNEIQFKSNKNKAYKLFETGFSHDTLCYLNNLPHVIRSFFNC